MNMSYCRFRNTSGNLQDCIHNWNDPDLSKEEQAARMDIVQQCYHILTMIGVDIEAEQHKLEHHLDAYDLENIEAESDEEYQD